MLRGVGQCFCCGLIEIVYRLFGLEYLFCKNCLSEKVKNILPFPIIEIDEKKGTCRITKKTKIKKTKTKRKS